MTEKISGFSKTGADTRLTRTRSGDEAGHSSKTTRGGTSAAGDQFELTGAATRLKALEARLKNMDDVDSRRVAEIRQRIEAGEYEVDPKKIADSLLELEQKLFS